MSLGFRIFIYPFLWIISILPFPVLYAISDFIAFLLYKVIGYRRIIVQTNLRNSFPDKSENERKQIEKRYYSFMADLIVETIKTMTISKKELLKRMKLEDDGLFEKLRLQGKSCVVVMSHCGNWEWVCASAQPSVHEQQKAQCVYKTLSNPSWDQWFYNVRSRFGTKPFPMKKTLRVMMETKNQITATAFIGDQNPSNGKNAYWTRFLNQDTCFMTGSEKIARKMNHTVLYLSVSRVRRGWYICKPHVLCENPSETQEFEITERIVQFTEKDIQQKPEFWLWSHRRWKHKKD